MWRQGDWVRFSERSSCVITGRSDATLNRGGVRLGTGEFYSVVEDLPEVVDSLVVHLEADDGGNGELLLFVVLGGDAPLDEVLDGQIRQALRAALSPRHAPDTIVAMPGVPRSLTGKKLELPVKKILQGARAAHRRQPGRAGRSRRCSTTTRPTRRARSADRMMLLEDLVAIDTHVHVEQDSHGCLSVDQELLDAAGEVLQGRNADHADGRGPRGLLPRAPDRRGHLHRGRHHRPGSPRVEQRGDPRPGRRPRRHPDPVRLGRPAHRCRPRSTGPAR